MWVRLRARVSRALFVLQRRRLDEETRLECDAHLELLTERYRVQGLSPDEAYVAARRQFGNPAVMRQQLRDMNSIGWIEQAMQDARYAVRQIRGNAAYAGVVVATLGLGIGGATAVFSVVQAVLLAPLPYEAPGQLVRFYQQQPEKPDSRDVLAATHFTFVRQHASSFDDVAALAHYRETGLDLVAGGRAVRLRVLRVSSGYFNTLRSRPRLGRDFEAADETGTNRVVLSDRVWRTQFAADPSIVGTVIRLNAESYEVAGIAPAGFEDPVAPDVAAWIPYDLVGDDDPENTSLTGIGRLRNGVSLEQARQELASLAPAMRERWPKAEKNAVVAVPLRDDLVTEARGPVRLVFAAVALVLLAACVNVANLALVRATGRVNEFAVRAALGSGRGRLVRQLLVENLLLACLGGGAGILLAAIGIRALASLGHQAIPRLDDVALSPEVLIFAVVVSIATAVAFGTAPALRLSATAPLEAMRQQTRSATATRGLARLRLGLAALQVALALTLLAGAVLLLASFHRLQQVDLGVRVDGVVTFEVNLPTVRYDEGRRALFQEELASRLEAIPGTVAAGGISRLPATGSYHPWNAHIRSGPLAGTPVDKRRHALQQRVISGRLLDAFAIPLRAGRAFDARDDAGAPPRAVVSENLARVAFPGLPLDGVPGQRLAVGGVEREIVGVVGDVALDAYGASTMVVYHAHRQFAGDRNWALTQVVTTARAPGDVLADVRREVARLDPELVVHRPATMTEVVGRGTSRERFALALMGIFAVVAVALAALGLYGVLAYAVRQRSAEIGIRVALGASAGRVRALVLRQAAVVVAVGLGAGCAGALLLNRWLDALVFGIAPSDPRILVASALLLSLVALIAAWLPAQRAARVEPRVAMQEGR
jgi:predicted permease